MKYEDKLKPCPFCGGTANIAKGRIEFWAYCPHCGARTEFYETEREAVDAWNARPIEDAQTAEIARLRGNIEAIKKIVDKPPLSIYAAAQIYAECCDALKGEDK